MRKKVFFAGKATKGRAVGGLGLVFLLDATVGGKVDGLVVVDKAFVVVVRPAGGRAALLDFVVEQFATDETGRLLFHQFTNLAVQFLYLLRGVSVGLLALQLCYFVDITADEHLLFRQHQSFLRRSL